MQGWIGLLGVLTGGLMTIAGQYFVRTVDRRSETVQLTLEQCAQVIALEEDFRNRVWEERKLGLQGLVGAWSLADYRLAEARLRIVCRDDQLHEALRNMNVAGIALGGAWRQEPRDEEAADVAWRQHRAALNQRPVQLRWRRQPCGPSRLIISAAISSSDDFASRMIPPRSR